MAFRFVYPCVFYNGIQNYNTNLWELFENSELVKNIWINDYQLINVQIGIDYIELILSYTLNKIKENDKIEIEKMLKSHLNPELGGKLMNSLAHSWKNYITCRK
ncbi:transposase, YhgA-like family protein [Rickettsia endosymbiont of Ixodes pacificus]|nr:transposase, YhgA-like family protein [Rickettsia endosymbiont of Ixodes pacificus]